MCAPNGRAPKRANPKPAERKGKCRETESDCGWSTADPPSATDATTAETVSAGVRKGADARKGAGVGKGAGVHCVVGQQNSGPAERTPRCAAAGPPCLSSGRGASAKTGGIVFGWPLFADRR